MPRALAIALCLGGLCAGQTPAQPSFTVVSVKPSAPDELLRPAQEMRQQEGGYWSVHMWSVNRLILSAYQVGPNLIVGMPSSLDQSYDIEARMPTDTNPTQFRLMLQSLLADRFKLRAHTEVRPTAVVVMTADKPGRDMHRASGQCTPPGQVGPHPCGAIEGRAGRELSGYSVTMADLANALTAGTIRPVVDETEMKGLYDFDFTLTYLAPIAGESQGQQVVEAEQAWRSEFKKQLGLDLDMSKTVKRPFPVLVIDHLEPASAN